MKTLTIRWQRLLNKNARTCPRCTETGENVKTAYEKLKKALAGLGVGVELEREALDYPAFSKDPLQSNRVWVGGKLVEEWLGGTAGRSRCCDECEGSECRTISLGQNTFEAIPEDFIIRAALLAAEELLREGAG